MKNTGHKLSIQHEVRKCSCVDPIELISSVSIRLLTNYQPDKSPDFIDSLQEKIIKNQHINRLIAYLIFCLLKPGHYQP